MMRTKLAILAAGSAAALALGAFAAPAANADEARVQVVQGEAFSDNAGTLNGTDLDDDLLDSCRAIGINAQSARNDSALRTIELYSAAGCAATALLDTVNPSSFKDTAGTATHYKFVL